MPNPAFTTPAAAVRIGSAMARCVLYESLRQTAERQTHLTPAERVAPRTLGNGNHERAMCQAEGSVASRASLHLCFGSPPAPTQPGPADHPSSPLLPMLISELGLAHGTQNPWKAAGVQHHSELRHPARELLMLPGITGSVLYETVCRPHDHHISLRAEGPQISKPTRLDLELLRMGIVGGASLREIGKTHHLSAGFATGSIASKARAAVSRLESKGFLTVLDAWARPNHVAAPHSALRHGFTDTQGCGLGADGTIACPVRPEPAHPD
jgi:hypothetical protein